MVRYCSVGSLGSMAPLAGRKTLIIMPYILAEFREVAARIPVTPGELNYAMTRLAVEYAERQGVSYNTIGEIVAAFECAKLELYRRLAAPYEDKKARDNGDVYPSDRRLPDKDLGLLGVASETPICSICKHPPDSPDHYYACYGG